MQHKQLTAKGPQPDFTTTILSFTQGWPKVGLVMGVVFSSLILQQQAIAAFLTDWQFNQKTGQLQFKLPAGSKPKYVVQQANRLVLDLPKTQVTTDITELYENGPIRQISLTQLQPDLARIVIDFNSGSQVKTQHFVLEQLDSENRWLFKILTTPQTGVNSPNIVQSIPTKVNRSPVSGIPSPTEETEKITKPITTEVIQNTRQLSYDPIQEQEIKKATTPPITTQKVTVPLSNLNDFRNNQIDPLESKEPVLNPTNKPNLSGTEDNRIAPVTPIFININTRSQNPPPVVTTSTRSTRVVNSNYRRTRGTETSYQINTTSKVIPFGDPLPDKPIPTPIPNKPNQPNQPNKPNQNKPISPLVFLPKDTILKLIYPGTMPLSLKGKPSPQEVLLLQSNIVDKYGNIMIPSNTPIIGRFETDRDGSRFIAQAINLYGRTIPLAARSKPVSGTRHVSSRNLARNTSVGGLALLIISGFSGIGLLAGAAAGATATFVTAPEPAIIQPGQIIELRLTEDLSRSSL